MRNGGIDSPPDISPIRLGGGAGVGDKDYIQCAKCHGGVFSPHSLFFNASYFAKKRSSM